MGDSTAGTITTNTTLLGDLGIQSNIPGSCDLTFTSTNAFKLLKGNSGGGFGSTLLTTYSLTYGGDSISHGGTITKECQDHVKKDLNFIPINDGTALANGLAESGDYIDTITVTLTTE